MGRGLIICAWSEYCMSCGFERFCTIASPPPPILIILWMISPTHKKCGFCAKTSKSPKKLDVLYGRPTTLPRVVDIFVKRATPMSDKFFLELTEIAKENERALVLMDLILFHF